MCRVEEKKEIKVGDEVLILRKGMYYGAIGTVECCNSFGLEGLEVYELNKEELKKQLEERREELHYALCEARQDRDTELIEMITEDWNKMDEEIYRLKSKNTKIAFTKENLGKIEFEEEDNMITALAGIRIGDKVKIIAMDSPLANEEIKVIGIKTIEDTPVLLLSVGETIKLLKRKRNKLKLTSDTILENLIIEDIDRRIKAILEKGIVFTTPDRVQKVEETSHLETLSKIAKGDVIKVTSERNPFFGYKFSVSRVEDERIVPDEDEVLDALDDLIFKEEDYDMLCHLDVIERKIDNGDEIMFKLEEVEKVIVATVKFSYSDKLKEAIKPAHLSVNNNYVKTEELTKRFSDEMKNMKEKFEKTAEQNTLRLIEVGDIVSHVDIKGLHKVTEKTGMYVVLMSQDNNGGFNGFESVVADSKINGLRLEFGENQVREPYNDDIGRTVRFITKNFPEIECIIELENGEIYRGKSRCNLMEDEFDGEKGRKIAFFRANKKMAEDISKRCDIQLNKITQ